MNPVFVAIDTPDLGHARQLLAAVAPHVGGVKLGLEFFAAHGPAGVAALATGLPLFLDLKFHDIPNTVAGAIRAVGALAPALVTVHAGGGRAMLAAARDAAPPGTRVVAVTVLTSLGDADLGDTGVEDTAARQVERLAMLARDCGLGGIVCSPLEAAAIKAAWPQAFLVVPGIRPAGSDPADQQRSATPAAALAAGASVLVIGRPITAAADPAAAAAAIAASLA